MNVLAEEVRTREIARFESLADFFNQGLAWKSRQEFQSVLYRNEWLKGRVSALFHQAWARESSAFTIGYGAVADRRKLVQDFWERVVLIQKVFFDREHDAELQNLLEQLRTAWMSMWQQICEQLDKDGRGHFPSLKLYHAFLSFANLFRIRIKAHLCNVAVNKTNGELAAKWISLLEAKLTSAYWGTHSCSFQEKHLGPDTPISHSTLIIQTGLPAETFSSEVERQLPHHISDVKATQILENMPFIGMVLEQVPVNFVANPDRGWIEVGQILDQEPDE